MEEINLKEFLHPVVIGISAINHGSLTVALASVLIIASQRVAKCDLSKPIKKTYIWYCYSDKNWMRSNHVWLGEVLFWTKHSLSLVLLRRKNRKRREWSRWRLFTICQECQSHFSSTMDSPSNTVFVLRLGRKWYHRLNHGRSEGGIPV